MIKRPLNPQFNESVLAGRKVTTIRDSPWPLNVPIMLYNWSERAYRSKQVDVAPVAVESATLITITHDKTGAMLYVFTRVGERSLQETEGFGSDEAMDAWFRPLVDPGKKITKYLNHFALFTEPTIQ